MQSKVTWLEAACLFYSPLSFYRPIWLTLDISFFYVDFGCHAQANIVGPGQPCRIICLPKPPARCRLLIPFHRGFNFTQCSSYFWLYFGLVLAEAHHQRYGFVHVISNSWILPQKLRSNFILSWALHHTGLRVSFEVSKCSPEFGKSVFARIALWNANRLHPDQDSKVGPLQTTCDKAECWGRYEAHQVTCVSWGEILRKISNLRWYT